MQLSQTAEPLKQTPTSRCPWPDSELFLSETCLQSVTFLHKKNQVKWFLQYQTDKPVSGHLWCRPVYLSSFGHWSASEILHSISDGFFILPFLDLYCQCFLAAGNSAVFSLPKQFDGLHLKKKIKQIVIAKILSNNIQIAKEAMINFFNFLISFSKFSPLLVCPMIIQDLSSI